ncbi:MAG: YbaN family protein [Bacteroidetes bacterium]|uniref:YbaN family protein n=1 Tax=Candidatus Merdivivens pullistercoris TaxID=2840873 RepID=A0A9D9I4S8_9BACT|nr:YbaN family protein [Candidatus Merdivivens pullistercoris]
MSGKDVRKVLYVGCGTVCTLLALAGIVLPGLPATPFLLLASWLFIRSSPSLHARLESSRLFGPYLKRYRERGGVTAKGKTMIVILMLSVVAVSCIFFLESLALRLIVVSAGIAGAVCVIFFVPGASCNRDHL